MTCEAEFRAAVAAGPTPDPERFTVLTRREWEELPEYATTLPTGQRVGKRWKRDIEQTCPPGFQRNWPRSRWLVGEYVDVGSATEIGIRWTWPLVI